MKILFLVIGGMVLGYLLSQILLPWIIGGYP